MWITEDVNLPDELIQAHSEGKLVFFVGAGASMSAPANQPSFEELVKDLAMRAGCEYDPTKHKNILDQYLGSLPSGFDVHKHTKDLISKPNSSPNDVHRYISRLAAKNNSPRIVTTNFDEHLSEAAELEELDISNIWTAPALPYGGDFTGIVHLHGSVAGDEKNLILTDGDFGRAYLAHSWATNFLLPMFSEYTVLFIGYSHSDPLMRYLARGLTTNTPRYSLSEATEDAVNWKDLRIELIAFDNQAGDFSSLPRALKAWDELSTSNRSSHIARMKSIVSNGVVLSPVDHDYVVARIGRKDGVKDFVAATKSLEVSKLVDWLHWIEEKPVFQRLFDAGSESSCSLDLAWWFGETFIKNLELNGVALRCLGKFGGEVSNELFEVIALCADALSDDDPEASFRWRVILATSIQGSTMPANFDLLSRNLGRNSDHSLMIRALLHPYIRISKRDSVSGYANTWSVIPRISIEWGERIHELPDLIDQPARSEGERARFLRALADSLEMGYQLGIAYYGQKEDLNFMGYRSAIPDHEQDSFPDAIDFIVNGLRDIGEQIVNQRTDLIEEWWGKGYPLFQRLAIHLLNISTLCEPDSKINWLLENDLLFRHEYRYEVFDLLGKQITEVSQPVKSELLTRVMAGEGVGEREADRSFSEYTRYNLLYWLTTHDKLWKEGEHCLRELQDRNPNFKPREFPNLLSWSVSGGVHQQFPMSVDEFISSIQEGQPSYLGDLVGREYSNFSTEGPTWQDFLALLETVVVADPKHGLVLFEEVESLDVSHTQEKNIKRSIIRSWRGSNLGIFREEISGKLKELTHDEEFYGVISEFLLEQCESLIDTEGEFELTSFRNLASAVWVSGAESFTHNGNMDLVEGAALYLNAWPGFLAQFWIIEIQLRWRSAPQAWQGLDEGEEKALQSMLQGNNYAFDATFPALCRSFRFFLEADEEFTVENIIPKFEDRSTALLAWSSFLQNPGWSNRFIKVGLLDSLLKSWDEIIDLLTESARRTLFQFVIWVLTYSTIDTSTRKALLNKTVTSHERKFTADFIYQIAQLLRRSEVDLERAWEKWLQEYFEMRVQGSPRDANSEELAMWADLIPDLGNHGHLVVERLRGKSIGLRDFRSIQSVTPDILKLYGKPYADFFAHRIKVGFPPEHSGNGLYRLRYLRETLQGQTNDEFLKVIEEAIIEQLGPLGNA